MRTHPLATLLLTGALLTACGTALNPSSGDEAPARAGLSGQSLTAASGSSLRTYQADLAATTTLNVAGLPTQVGQSPAGLNVAYLFNNGQVKTRLDLPGASFSDGRARIAVYDTASSRARVVFADTLAQDGSMDTTQLTTLLQHPVNFGNSVSTSTFQTQSSASFKSRMSAQGVTTTDTTTNQNGTTSAVVQARKTFNTPNGGTQSTTLSFNPQVGMVTTASSTVSSSEGTQNTTTSFTYDTVTNLPNVRIPTRVSTTGQLTASGTGGSATLTQDVNYQNPQLNTLPDTYFNIGGL